VQKVGTHNFLPKASTLLPKIINSLLIYNLDQVSFDLQFSALDLVLHISQESLSTYCSKVPFPSCFVVVPEAEIYVLDAVPDKILPVNLDWLNAAKRVRACVRNWNRI